MLTLMTALALAQPLPADEATEEVPTTAELARAGVPRAVADLPFVDRTQLRIDEAVKPTYPEDAQEENLDAILCVVHVHVRPDGSTGGAWVQGCPEVFHPETRHALSQWTWERPAMRVPGGDIRTRVDVDYRIVDGF